MRAFARRGFQHTRAQALAAHFQQAELADPAHLNARPIIGERGLHCLFNLTDIAVRFHVDEIDHDKAGHIPQAELTGNFLRGFQIGRQRRLFNPMFARGAARVNVDRHQGFGWVDDQIAA